MKTWKNGKFAIAVVVGCILALGCAAAADDAAAGRDIAAKWGNSVVTVQLVVKVSMPFGGEKEETKSEVTGTVIDPTGLTVVSLSNTDPVGALASMFGGAGGPEVSSEVADVKIRMSDGKEVPAKVVLRDKDLDLAFIRPTKKLESPVPALDLKDSAKIEFLDQVLVLNRLGKVANRALAGSFARGQAVVEKPRKFYVLEPQGAGALGAPVIALDGKVIGILLLRSAPASAKADISGVISMLFNRSGGMGGALTVTIPADEIASAAAQAPEEAPKEPAKPAKPVTKPAVKKGKN